GGGKRRNTNKTYTIDEIEKITNTKLAEKKKKTPREKVNQMNTPMRERETKETKTEKAFEKERISSFICNWSAFDETRRARTITEHQKILGNGKNSNELNYGYVRKPLYQNYFE
ncbi:unnamed protein product, partial [Didymodactylos carnosus]